MVYKKEGAPDGVPLFLVYGVIVDSVWVLWVVLEISRTVCGKLRKGIVLMRRGINRKRNKFEKV